MVPAEDLFALLFELLQDGCGQRARQPECAKIAAAFLFQMRQVIARMKTFGKRRGAGIRSAGKSGFQPQVWAVSVLIHRLMPRFGLRGLTTRPLRAESSQNRRLKARPAVPVNTDSIPISSPALGFDLIGEYFASTRARAAGG